MIAVESNSRLCGLTELPSCCALRYSRLGRPGALMVRGRAFAVVTPPTTPRNRDTAGTWRWHDMLANALRWAGQVLERRRLAEIAWQKRPLSLDDAWAGGWYARSRSLQQALVQHDRRAHAAPASSTQDWDDRLD